MNDKLKGQLRHVLGAGAAYALGKGWLSESNATELINIGLIVIPFLWSWFAKKPGAPAPVDTTGSSGTTNT